MVIHTILPELPFLKGLVVLAFLLLLFILVACLHLDTLLYDQAIDACVAAHMIQTEQPSMSELHGEG